MTPGETLGTLYSSGVGTNKTKQPDPLTLDSLLVSGFREGREGATNNCDLHLSDRNPKGPHGVVGVIWLGVIHDPARRQRVIETTALVLRQLLDFSLEGGHEFLDSANFFQRQTVAASSSESACASASG